MLFYIAFCPRAFNLVDFLDSLIIVTSSIFKNSRYIFTIASRQYPLSFMNKNLGVYLLISIAYFFRGITFMTGDIFYHPQCIYSSTLRLLVDKLASILQHLMDKLVNA